MPFRAQSVLTLVLTLTTQWVWSYLGSTPLLFPASSKGRIKWTDLNSAPTSHISKTDSHEIFYKQPELRKIAKAYLHRKIFSLNECLVEQYPSSCKVEMVPNDIVNILRHILCPLTERETLYEYQRLSQKLNSKSTVDEYELFDALLHNRQWTLAGELIVKEFIYLDSMLSIIMEYDDPLLSRECVQKVKDDLECNLSNVPSYSNDEIVYLLASSHRDRSLSEIVSDEMYRNLEDKLKKKMSSVYLAVKQMRASNLEEHDIHNSIFEYLLKYPVSKF